MIKITYKSADGTDHTVDASPGDTLMSAAVNNAVPGIDGDCGGNCACATCHLYIESDLVGERGDEEEDMLSIADEVKQSSRLGCQIEITERMNGLVVQIPFGQH